MNKGKDREKFIEELVAEVTADFENRRKERLGLERQWELNLNFISGNQYVGIDGRGELFEEEKAYFWQSREVFNHISPILESRLAKFSKIKPVFSVRPATDSNEDEINAERSEKLISSVFEKEKIHQTVRSGAVWSESCGTAFYKVVWCNDGGKAIGVADGKQVYEGEVSVIAVSPFEIYPENLYAESIEEQGSIIHAKAVSVAEVKKLYGVTLAGEEVSLLKVGQGNKRKNYLQKEDKKDSVIVIEKYERPTEEYPNGRLITVAGGHLLYYGELPYKNGENGRRTYPFIRQESFRNVGCFFGKSIVERLIPVQRAYNAVKNRKHEFINRLTAGVMTVEDGSIDVDDLSAEGLSPGKVLVYRQGAKAPEIMDEPDMPKEFSDEENKLLDEFVIISGTSDLNSSSENAGVTSGTALQILLEQDNERLSVQAENIRNCCVEIAKHLLRLYSQHGGKMVTVRKGKKDFEFINIPKIPADDVIVDGQNELGESKVQRRDAIMRIYESGLLENAEGNVTNYVKEKVLALLGYKELDARKGASTLHEEKAQAENAEIKKSGRGIDGIDDDGIHEYEHTRYVLSEYKTLTEEEKQRFYAHVQLHKERRVKDKE